MKTPNTIKSHSEIIKLLDILDHISALLVADIVDQKLLDFHTLSTRYYIALHDILLPIAIKNIESSLPRAFLAPITSVYIHEQKVYAILRSKRPYGNLNHDYISRIPVIDLTSNEDLLALASTAIAFKIALSPSERNILRVIPNNIRTYVEAALKIIENLNFANSRIDIDEKPISYIRTPSMIELVVWINELAENDIVEVRYLKGISLRIFRIIYRDYEIDIKSSHSVSAKFATKIFMLLPSNILANMFSNVESTYRILSIYKIMNS